MTRPQNPDQVSLRLLHRLSNDVLQRGPTPAEATALVGADVAAVVPRMVQSREAMAAWFEEEAFYFLLIDQFRPRGEAIERVPQRLHRNELTARDALAELLLSTGFSARNPGNDTFVTVLLEQCLGYTVQEPRHQATLAAGRRIYDGARGRFLGEDAGNQADLIRIALRHPDAARHLLDRHHRRLFGAPLPRSAPEPAALHADPRQFFATIGTWLQGGRYRQALAARRRKTERQFLRGLWMDLLGRQPAWDELRQVRLAMQSMADPSPLRAVLGKVILDSDEVQLPACAPGAEADFVQRCFLRYLAREPSPAEAAAFTQALQREGARPALVVRALIGSLEYQTC